MKLLRLKAIVKLILLFLQTTLLLIMRLGKAILGEVRLREWKGLAPRVIVKIQKIINVIATKKVKPIDIREAMFDLL